MDIKKVLMILTFSFLSITLVFATIAIFGHLQPPEMSPILFSLSFFSIMSLVLLLLTILEYCVGESF